MGDEFHMEIPIPTDKDGFVLLKCHYCGELFKASASDIKDDGILLIFCPSCGLYSDNYLTDDVLALASAMAQNRAMNLISKELKKMERELSHGIVTFKVSKQPTPEPENPIRSGIEALEISHFPCCNRQAKIKPLLKMTGCYCPFCGVKNYEIEQN